MEGTQVLAIQQCTAEILTKLNPTTIMSHLEAAGVFNKQDVKLIRGETGVDVQIIAVLHAVKRKQSAWQPFLDAIQADGHNELATKLSKLQSVPQSA